MARLAVAVALFVSVGGCHWIFPYGGGSGHDSGPDRRGVIGRDFDGGSILPDIVGCDPLSCPHGCCDGATCVTPTAAHCGQGGVPCQTCGSGQLCNAAGVCETPVCSPSTCGGCCNANKACINPSDNACGKGGADCVDCSSRGETCDAATGLCLSPVTCTACTGCCQLGKCLPGTSSTACGGGGATCATCLTGQTCKNGQCVQDCGAANCNGCCSFSGMCKSGQSDVECGINGDPCIACFGQKKCTGGLCLL